MTNPIDDLAKTVGTSYVVLGIVAILIAAAVAPGLYSTTTEPEEPHVAIVELDGPIAADRADATIAELREVRENDSIEAVVLEVNSPGGAAAASEAQYMAVKRLAAEKPVVTAVRGMAASGMYYTILPTMTIFVTPASLVGNVGVRAAHPPNGGVPDDLTTGPDKLTGGTAEEARARVQTLNNAFVGTVMSHRGDRIDLTREQVAHGKIYAGARAVDNGFADDIGDTESAVKAVARAAGLRHYQVVRRTPVSDGGLLIIAGSGHNSTVVRQPLFGYSGVDTQQYLMLYGRAQTEPEVVDNES
jgi:protease-4